jgi:hypothetical protein
LVFWDSSCDPGGGQSEGRRKTMAGKKKGKGLKSKKIQPRKNLTIQREFIKVN